MAPFSTKNESPGDRALSPGWTVTIMDGISETLPACKGPNNVSSDGTHPRGLAEPTHFLGFSKQA